MNSQQLENQSLVNQNWLKKINLISKKIKMLIWNWKKH